MKKYTFLKYFIKNKVFAGEGKGGARRAVPLGARLGVPFLLPIWFGGGDTQTRPRSASLPCLSTYAFMYFGKGFLSFGWSEALD